MKLWQRIWVIRGHWEGGGRGGGGGERTPYVNKSESVPATHELFHTSICIFTLPTQYTTFI